MPIEKTADASEAIRVCAELSDLAGLKWTAYNNPSFLARIREKWLGNDELFNLVMQRYWKRIECQDCNDIQKALMTGIIEQELSDLFLDNLGKPTSTASIAMEIEKVSALLSSYFKRLQFKSPNGNGHTCHCAKNSFGVRQ